MKQSNDFRSLNEKIGMNDTEREKVQEQINLKMIASPDVSRKAPTPRKYYIALASAALIFTLILLPAIFNNLEKLSDSVIVADEIPPERLEEILAPYEYDEILHVETVDGGVVVFFTKQIKKDITFVELNALFIKKTQKGWEESKETRGHTYLESHELSPAILTSSNEDLPLPLVFGKIIHPDISKVFVRKVENQQEYMAETIISGGEKYWFTFVDIRPDEMFEIHGLDREGQIIYSIHTLYENGSYPVLEEANPEAANFKLSKEEREIYEQLKAEFNTQLLIVLSPVSIAKLFVQATVDEEWELKYELYTDRDDVMRMEKEEYLREMVYPNTNTLFGIQDGTFHDNGDGSGYISYINLYGQEYGFQMVKEEDGSWAVSFMPIQ